MSVEATSAKTGVKTAEAVYVFGSDLAGRHSEQTAVFAARYHHAEAGKASGPSGNAFAIPYRNSIGDLLPLEVIANYVKPFLRYAQARPRAVYQVARFACEPGAHTDEDMARLFARRPSNCQVPGVWVRRLDATRPARLLLFDPGARLKNPVWQERLGDYLSLNAPLWNAPAVEIVSSGVARSIVATDLAANRLGLKHRVFGPNEACYGRDAYAVAEHKAVWYATHFLSISDFDQTTQPLQIRITAAATRGGLMIDQIDAHPAD